MGYKIVNRQILAMFSFISVQLHPTMMERAKKNLGEIS
jgi:hypothetical protein